MSVKTSGAEFCRFYNDDTVWPENVWHDDTLIRVNGVEREDIDPEAIAPTDEITIVCGYVYGLGLESEPTLEAYFESWREKQTTSRVVIEFDTTQREAVEAAIKAAGGRIVQ